MGTSDSASFSTHEGRYNLTMWELHSSFEDSYVAFVKAIRQLAYPRPDSKFQDDYGMRAEPITTPASMPIFILRPLTGALEHETLGAVQRLRAEGDAAVFWIDTTGWLTKVSDSEDDLTTTQDFFLDNNTKPPTQRLTELGNQKVAIFLHAHVCRYLASRSNECAFLPPDVYHGSGYVPEEETLDGIVSSGREKKLKQIFWDNEE